MTQATAPRCTYRKTRNEIWAVMGPAETIVAGAEVTVTKKSGETKTERIDSVGKVFTRDGVSMRYGYPDRTASGPAYVRTSDGRLTNPTSTSSRRSSGQPCDECHERRGYIRARDMSGIPGLVCGTCIRDEGSLSFA